MGGDISVESVAGKGSTFSVRLPRRVAQGAISPATHARGKAFAPERPVLIVDDDADCRDLLARVLERRGYEVTQASDGREALSALARDGASAVVLDLRMPVMDGFHLLQEMQGHPELGSIPVVVVSAVADAERGNAALRARATVVMQKGECTPNQVLDAIEATLLEDLSDCDECNKREAG
jgi:CheY-like chemotaxis protein